MADNVTLNAGAGGVTLATDDVGGVHYQLVKLSYGALDAATIVSASNGLPVAQQGTWTVTGAGGSFPVTDSAGSLTVDAPVGTPVFVQLSDGAAPITTLPVSLATVPSHAVTNAGTFAVQAAQSGTWNVTVNAAIAAGNNNIGDVDIASIAAGTNNIGDVDVLTVPTDPFGANADAASATGSISAKLRFIAATGIPVTALPTLASVTTVSTLTNITNWGNVVDDAAFSPGVTRLLMVGLQADETATDSVDEGDAGAARMTLDRKAIVTTHPHTQGGVNTAAGSITTTVTSVKASAGQLYGWYIYNANASAVYCQIFDLATGSVTLGTTTPKLSFGIPAGSAANVGLDVGIAFGTAISIAFTTTRAGLTAPASSVDYNFLHF